MLRQNVISKMVMVCALMALLLLSACTMVITPEADTGAATPAPQEESTEEASGGELVGPTWQWVQTQMSDDTLITPTDPSRYTLTFNEDGTVFAQLDCNTGRGSYEVDGPTITFSPMASTMMACPEDSQANDFSLALENVNSHVFQDGHLFLALKLDSGIMEFAPVESGEEATPEATEEPSEEASGELVGPTWQWVETVMGDGTVITPSDPTVYTLTFNNDGTVSAQIDCNSGSGTYQVDGASLTFGAMATTLMACLGDSQADQFSVGLSNVNSHVFQDGHLFLALQYDSGIMEFAPVEAGGEATPEATEEATEEPSASGELVGPTWQWVQSVYEGDMIVASNDPTRYTITFLEDGTIQAQLDCNTGFGSYTLDGSNLTIGPIGSTRMACPDDSLDSTFIEDLEAVASYAIADGNLHLTLSTDGVMELSPAP